MGETSIITQFCVQDEPSYILPEIRIPENVYSEKHLSGIKSSIRQISFVPSILLLRLWHLHLIIIELIVKLVQVPGYEFSWTILVIILSSDCCLKGT